MTETKLKVDKDSAKHQLLAQIERGNKIRNQTITSSDELSTLKRDRAKWESYVQQLLLGLFSTSAISQEFSRRRPPPVNNTWGFPKLADRERVIIADKVNVLESIIERLNLFASAQHESIVSPEIAEDPKVFIVHGHDTGLLNEVQIMLTQLELKYVVLQHEPSGNKTVIEKFESYADADFAIVLLTPDDRGGPISSSELKTRARQNVILELGYFYGALGRKRVTAIQKSVEDIPSDIVGVLNVVWDKAGSWRFKFCQEMRHAGLPVDSNKLK